MWSLPWSAKQAAEAAAREAEPATHADLIEALGHMVKAARREFPVVGTDEHPTPWDKRHQVINGYLDQLEIVEGMAGL